MLKYVAKRIRFRNGERYSVLSVPNGLPVHEVAVYLDKYRRKGRAANTVHFVCCSLALLFRELDKAKVKLIDLLVGGRFLTIPELERVASAVQYRVDDLEDTEGDEVVSNVIHIARIGLRRKTNDKPCRSVSIQTQASRLRYIADYLEFIAAYVGATLTGPAQQALAAESARALSAFREHIPEVSNRAKLGAREGLSFQEQDRLLNVVHPDSPENPWKRGFVSSRNWLVVVLLLASGMRRSELLGLQIGDLHSNQPKLRIIRRADSVDDPRLIQPNTKTSDREIELTPAIMKVLWSHINLDRRKIKAARKVPQIFVSDEGAPLSESSIDKIFVQMREACPGLPVKLTSHVMRHTWNERFSEQADAMGISESVEMKARNNQQGWSDDSEMGTIYTRRHTAKKGREISLKNQEKLDEKLNRKN
jgi:integrase